MQVNAYLRWCRDRPGLDPAPPGSRQRNVQHPACALSCNTRCHCHACDEANVLILVMAKPVGVVAQQLHQSKECNSRDKCWNHTHWQPDEAPRNSRWTRPVNNAWQHKVDLVEGALASKACTGKQPMTARTKAHAWLLANRVMLLTASCVILQPALWHDCLGDVACSQQSTLKAWTCLFFFGIARKSGAAALRCRNIGKCEAAARSKCRSNHFCWVSLLQNCSLTTPILAQF